MKTRMGFVSNSSSCSFSIMRSALSVNQYDHLRNHIAFAKLKKWGNNDWVHYEEGDSWDIELTEDAVKCDTPMDNFNLYDFVLEVLMVPDDAIIDHWHS